MPRITMYMSERCGYCQSALHLLARKGVGNIDSIDVDKEPAQRAMMTARTGRRTVPQVFIGEQHVGGFDDMAALELQGRLDGLLSSN